MKTKNLLVISSVLLGLLVAGCNQQSSSKSQEANRFSEVTTFDEYLEIHTEDQKNFVDYNGGYEKLSEETIKSTFHVYGNNSYSDSKTFDIEWEHEPKNESVTYQLELSTDKKFTDPWVFEAKGKKATISNLMIGTQYYYRVVADYDGDTSDYSKIYHLETEDYAPRNLKIGGMTNCRDLGGRWTVDGGRLKQGMLYRTAALDDSQSGSIINDEGKKTMLDYLKVKTEIELRGGPSGTGGEASKTDGSRLGETINFQYVPFAYQNGKNLLFRNIEPVRKTFDVLGNADNYPIFYHCRIGTDRTGLISLLLNGLLGVSKQEIYQDYLFSDFGSIGKTSTVGQDNQDSISGYLAQLEDFPGEKLQNKVYNFLLTIGVSAEKLDTIIDVMTEDEDDIVTGNNSKTVHIASVDNMTLTNTSISESNAIRSPKKSVTLTSGSKATYTFTSDETFAGKLYANISAKNTSSSIDKALKVTFDGSEVSLKTTSFATTALGFGTNDSYWIPAELGSISAEKDVQHTISIETKSTVDVSFAHFAFLMDAAPTITFTK